MTTRGDGISKQCAVNVRTNRIARLMDWDLVGPKTSRPEAIRRLMMLGLGQLSNKARAHASALAAKVVHARPAAFNPYTRACLQ
jgi:hypothetical protein